MAERRIFSWACWVRGQARFRVSVRSRSFAYSPPSVGAIFTKWSNSAQTTETRHDVLVWVAAAGVLFPASCFCVRPAPPQTFVRARGSGRDNVIPGRTAVPVFLHCSVLAKSRAICAVLMRSFGLIGFSSRCVFRRKLELLIDFKNCCSKKNVHARQGPRFHLGNTP